MFNMLYAWVGAGMGFTLGAIVMVFILCLPLYVVNAFKSFRRRRQMEMKLADYQKRQAMKAAEFQRGVNNGRY
jgi:uncharacterized membrane protein (DUF485 family)